MRFTTLHEAVSLSPQDYQSVLNDPHLQVGYEVEFVAVDPPPPSGKVTAKEKSQQLLRLQQQVFDQLTELGLGAPVEIEAKDYSSWNLTQDLSIAPDPRRPGVGFELVSPPQPVKQALANLKKVFDWMESQGHYTNNSTGFHVGVSFKDGDGIARVDKLKLLLLLGESYVMDLFDRKLNSFTESHLEIIRNAIASAQQLGQNWVKIRQVTPLIKILNAALDEDKYRTVNFSKIKKGYLEFRIMGNQDYHKRFAQVRDVILRYGFVLKAALDPNSFTQDYEKALTKLISQGLARANPTYPDLMTKYAVLGAGPLSKETANLDKFQRAQKAHDSGNERAFVVLMTMLITSADKYADVVENPNIINAAAMAYRLFLKKSGYDIAKFKKAMERFGIKGDANKKVTDYLETY